MQNSNFSSSPAVSSAPHVQSEASVVESTNGRRRLDLDPGSGSFLQSHAASAAITRSFLLNLSDKGHAWKAVPDDVKDFYWLEFQKEFIWDPELESVIKRRWLQQAATRYSDTLSKWRASGSKPSRIPEHVWDSWQKEWSTLEFKQRSTIASKNRRSETGGSGSGPSRHTGGSISMVERSVRMAKELGREPNPIELFEATHTKKTASGIEYVDQRSKAVADRVHALRETASQSVEGSNESCEPDLRQLFLEAAGGKRKQRVYGMGTKASHFYSSTSSHSTATSRDINVDQLRDAIKQEIQQEVQMMLESQRQQMREEMREEFRLEMRQLIAEMTRSTRDATAPAPQRDPSHSDSE